MLFSVLLISITNLIDRIESVAHAAASLSSTPYATNLIDRIESGGYEGGDGVA